VAAATAAPQAKL